MATLSKFDFLIVGQGLAGTMLVHFLLRSKNSFLVVDDSHFKSSSLVGAGIMNPITGRRLVKSWRADEIFPFAKSIYHEIEKLTSELFFHEMLICKLFANNQELNDWSGKEKLQEYRDYMVHQSINELEKHFHCEHGGFFIRQSGYVEMNKLVTAYRKLLREQSLLFEQKFDYKIQLENETAIWNGIEFSKIIFCEGNAVLQNPFFSWLPFKLAKGEILTAKIPELNLNHIVSKNIFILPMENDLYKIGSTYEWDFETDEPTEKGKNDLTERLRKTIKLPFEIIDHVAGIRPTNVDRRPYLGLHPKHKQLAVFNGLGTKGASLAPFFANQLSEFLISGKEINEEVNVKRFAQLSK